MTSEHEAIGRAISREKSRRNLRGMFVILSIGAAMGAAVAYDSLAAGGITFGVLYGLILVWWVASGSESA